MNRTRGIPSLLALALLLSTLMVPAPASATLYHHDAEGNLSVNGYLNEPFDVYFHVPIPYRDQAPMQLTVEGPNVLGYRYLRMDGNNALVCARLSRAPTNISWRSNVLVASSHYYDIPAWAPIPEPGSLPDSLSRWILASDGTQIDEPLIQAEAQALVNTSGGNLISLATLIKQRVSSIPAEFPHQPTAFDAYYTLNWWGNSCTGHAHAGAALFRAAGVPARIIMPLMPYLNGYMDMHWVIEYWVTDYGWVRMDPQIAINPMNSYLTVVTFAPEPEDEFPLFYPVGAEGCWHTSNRILGPNNPRWGLAHTAHDHGSVTASQALSTELVELTKEVFWLQAACFGADLPPVSQAIVDEAQVLQDEACAYMHSGNLNMYATYMATARDRYLQLGNLTWETIYLNDCEGGAAGWTHGGAMDMWELGTPINVGPSDCPSGENCWATNIDGDYFWNMDCWLLSPPIDLSDFANASLEMKLYLRQHEVPHGDILDKLWLEISIDDGATFIPFCDELSAGNDDPEVPQVGGWGRLILDLGAYVGEQVRIRYRFQTDDWYIQAGAYLDDIHVKGLRRPVTGIQAEDENAPSAAPLTLAAHPNPFNPKTSIYFTLPMPGAVKLRIFDARGRLVRDLLSTDQLATGRHHRSWDGRDDAARELPSGVYQLHLVTAEGSLNRKLVLLR